MARKGENIYLRKDGRWEGRYIKHRTMENKPKFGYVYGRNYIEVKRKLTVLKAESYREKDVVLWYKDGTLNDWMDYWLEECARPYIEETTCDGYERNIRNHLRPYLGEKPVSSITQDDVQSFIDFLDKSLAPSTVVGIFRLLKTILKAAQERNLISHNPFAKVKAPKQKQKPQRYLTVAEQRKLEREATKNGDLEYLICLYTGIRLGELCALKWRDIDFDSKAMQIKSAIKRVKNRKGKSKTSVIAGKPKSESSVRSIPVPAFLIKMLRDRFKKTGAQRQDYIIPGKAGRHIDPRTVQARFKKMTDRLGIKNAHMHTLRHTFATRCLEKQITYEVLCAFLGHSSPQITLRCYTHCTEEFKRVSINKLKRIAC